MKKITASKLVSLILQEINEQVGNQPGGLTLIGDTQDLRRYLQATESGNQHQGEMGEMAQEGEYEYQSEKLNCPMYIPVEALKLSSDAKAHIPAIKSFDPTTGEYVENVCIGDTVLTSPSGHRFLIFENFMGATYVDKKPKREKFYILLSENMEENNRFIKCKPRGNVYGKPIARDVRHQLAAPVAGETEDERKKREARVESIYRMMGKRYGIFPIVNETFSDPEVLDHLDKCLVPETWATSVRTEHPTNKVLVKKFGGNNPEIDVDFIAVRDLENVDKAIEDVMELRAALAMGDDNETDPTQREREYSKPIPRQHANQIYRNGNWHARQRAHDPNFFQRAGGKTPVYQLLSKNIQEGRINVVIKSVLEIKGNVRGLGEGAQYVLDATFTSKMNYRGTTGEGQEIGELFPRIQVGLRKVVPAGVDPSQVNFENMPEFFVNEGRTTKEGRKTGFFPTLMNNLANEIKTKIDPDEVLGTMIQLVQNAVDTTPPAELPVNA